MNLTIIWIIESMYFYFCEDTSIYISYSDSRLGPRHDEDLTLIFLGYIVLGILRSMFNLNIKAHNTLFLGISI